MKSLFRKFVLVLTVIMAILSIATPAMAASYIGAKESVARIYVELDTGYGFEGWSLGSGFAIGDKKNGPVKYFVTNRHVLGLDEFLNEGIPMDYLLEMIRVYVIFDNIQSKVPVNVEYVDDTCDLAVISLHEATKLRKPAVIRTMTTEEATKKHEQVFAIGFPGEVDMPKSYSAQSARYSNLEDMTVTRGIISGVASHGDTHCGEMYIIDAPINHGNSGGPLVDSKGRVIGVNTYGFENLNGAITSNEVVRMLKARDLPYLEDNVLRDVLIWVGAGLALMAVVAVVLVLVLKNKPVHGRALYGIKGSLEGQRFVLTRKMYIGRDSQKCAVAYPHDAPGVSKIHCCIAYNGKEVVVMDMNSKYGTWVDDHKLTPNTPTRLHRGHTLYIGSQNEALMLRNE